jgi:tRNA (cytidine/uridine-2'-O-)-methyltransferase
VTPVDPSEPILHLVLVHPEIPNNTGNIGRTAAALGARLHVVHPIGFDMDEKARRRAGLDYWHLVDCVEHADWGAYLGATPGARRWLFTAKATRSLHAADFQLGDHLLFGRESTGIEPELLEAFRALSAPASPGAENLLRIPMPGHDGIRSLNLATAAAIAGYEALRQIAPAAAPR